MKSNNRKFNPLPLDKEYGIHRSLLSDPKIDKDNNLDLGKFVDYRIDQRVEPPVDPVTDEHIVDVVNQGITDETIAIPSSLPYTTLVMKIHLDGSFNPVQTILENTTGATFVTTKPGNGYFAITPSADLFADPSKIWLMSSNFTQGSSGNQGFFSTIQLDGYLVSGVGYQNRPTINLIFHNGSQSTTPAIPETYAVNVEIRIYP